MSAKATEGFETYPEGTGYRLTFGNGWAVSVVWKGMTYSSNYDVDWTESPKSATKAEVAVLDPRGEIVSEGPDGDDNPAGWVTPDEVLAISAWAAAR